MTDSELIAPRSAYNFRSSQRANSLSTATESRRRPFSTLAAMSRVDALESEIAALRQEVANYATAFTAVRDQLALLTPNPVPPPVPSNESPTIAALYHYDPAILQDESCNECGDYPCEHEVPTQYDVRRMDPRDILNHTPLNIRARLLGVELCARCYQLGHPQDECPLQYDWRHMTPEEREQFRTLYSVKRRETRARNTARPKGTPSVHGQSPDTAQPLPPAVPPIHNPPLRAHSANPTTEKRNTPAPSAAKPMPSANRFALLEVEDIRATNTAMIGLQCSQACNFANLIQLDAS